MDEQKDDDQRREPVILHRRLLKIVLPLLLILLVGLAAVADQPSVAALLDMLHLSLNLPFFLRMVALLSLLIALVLAWGFKSRYNASQKFRLADQILAEAQATAKRKERAAMLLEEKLRAQYLHQAQMMQEQMDHLEAEHRKQLMGLKAQNQQLKKAAGKLMQALKKNTGKTPESQDLRSKEPQA